MHIIEFIQDPQLIAGDVSPFQETALRAFYGLPLTTEQAEIFRQCTGRESPPSQEFSEASFICGRRSGKSDRLAGNIAVYEAAFGEHEKQLSRGERGHILVIAQDLRAARVVYRYVLAKLESSLVLHPLIAQVFKEEIELTNNLTISILPCTFRAARGYSVPVAILDELAFFRVEGAHVDKEVVESIRPGQATFPRSKLIKISSPYAKRGEVYRDFSTRQSRPNLLCWQAASWLMNPAIPKSFLEAEQERDPEAFDREYGAQFTDQISSAFTREAVEACIVEGRFELPRAPAMRYKAAVDPSGGGLDEFTLSICHFEKGREKVVQDCLRGYRSRKPQDVVSEMTEVLSSYGISEVTGDRYSGSWVQDAFKSHSIHYHVADKTASEAFLELLPMINQGTIELLDEKKQTAQLIALERRKSRAGKDSLGHPSGGHDDRANALALSAIGLNRKRGGAFVVWGELGQSA